MTDQFFYVRADGPAIQTRDCPPCCDDQCLPMWTKDGNDNNPQLCTICATGTDNVMDTTDALVAYREYYYPVVRYTGPLEIEADIEGFNETEQSLILASKFRLYDRLNATKILWIKTPEKIQVDILKVFHSPESATSCRVIRLHQPEETSKVLFYNVRSKFMGEFLGGELTNTCDSCDGSTTSTIRLHAFPDTVMMFVLAHMSEQYDIPFQAAEFIWNYLVHGKLSRQ